MVNQHRGEVEANIDGRAHTLCLTLGALAELESAFGDDDMLALAKRFEGGRLSARDITRVIGAGLRGGGHDIKDEDVLRMRADRGAAGFIEIVARLLAVTFGGPAAAVAVDIGTQIIAGAIDNRAEDEEPRDPFPGQR